MLYYARLKLYRISVCICASNVALQAKLVNLDTLNVTIVLSSSAVIGVESYICVVISFYLKTYR